MQLLRLTGARGFSGGLIACAAAVCGCDGDVAVISATSGGGQGGDGAGTTSAGGQGGAGAGTTSAGGQGGEGGTGSTGGGSPGVAAVYASGPRLRARILDGGGGATRFLDWVDSTLEQRCLFSQHEDGSLRCLPVGAHVGYRDAACTDPVVYMPSCAEVPAFVSTPVSQDAPTCDLVLGGQAYPSSAGHHRAHAVGAAAPVPATLYFDYGDCLPIQSIIVMSYFELGAIEPAESFIAGAIEPMPVAGGLSLEREVAADGAWLVHRLARPDGATCETTLIGNDLRCAPRLEASLGNHYADASCAAPVASYPPADLGCPAPSHVRRGVPDPDGCGTTKTELLAVGAELDPSTLFAKKPGCGPLVPANPARAYYAVGEPLSPDAFPVLVPSPRGSGRLRSTGMEAADGTWLTLGGWGNYEGFIDSELGGGTSCEVSYFEDGVYRCAPQSYLSVSPIYHADASCSTPLYLVSKPAMGCAPPDPPRFTTGYGGNVTCSEAPNNGTANEVRPFIAYAGAIYSAQGPGCTLVGPELSGVYDFYVLGDPSPLDLFPALEVRVE